MFFFSPRNGGQSAGERLPGLAQSERFRAASREIQILRLQGPEVFLQPGERAGHVGSVLDMWTAELRPAVINFNVADS